MVDPLIHSVIRFLIAAIILASIFHKLRDFTEFKDVIKGYGLVPAQFSSSVAVLVLALETIVFLLLLLGLLPFAAYASASLFLLYGMLLATTLITGRDIKDCGCSWVKGASISPSYLYRNVGLVALSLTLTLPVLPRQLTVFDYINGSFSVVLMVCIYFLLDALLHMKTLEVSR